MTIELEELRKFEAPPLDTQKVWLFSEAVHMVMPLVHELENTTVLHRANELASAIKSRLETVLRVTGEHFNSKEKI